MRCFCFFFTVLTVSLYSVIGAFQLIPVTAHIDPAKGKKLFRLVNKDAFQKAVSVSVVKRSQDIDGEELLEDADEQFQVYPSQVILAPNSQQVVNITWLGPKDISEELAYRIIAEELPVDLEERSAAAEQNSGITILMRYEGTLYIRPQNVAPLIVVKNVATQVNENGNKELVVTIQNNGTCHEIFNEPRLVLTPIDEHGQEIKNLQVVLEGDSLEKIKGRNVLKNSERRFILACPEALVDSKVKGEFKGNA